MKNKKVILWVHDLDRDLLNYLREENVDVVAVVQAASKDGVPSISAFDLFYRTPKINFNQDDLSYIHLSDSFLNRYMDCISRVSFIPMTEAFTYIEIGVVDLDSVVDWAQYQAQTALSVLQQYQPDEIWITHSPHLGIDNILVEVARQLGLTVITFRQSLMPGKFFFNIVGNKEIEPKLLFTKPQCGITSEEPFYMNEGDALSNTQRFFERVSYYVMAPFKGKRVQLTERLYRALQKRDWALFLLLLDCLCARTREVAFTRFIRRLRFRVELKRRSFCHEDDLQKPFIYFALHKQPEASTSALGGNFTNQMNAIEAMREILPGGWRILIKENPQQHYMYRSLAFYERVRQLPDVKIVDDSAKSDELIKQSRIVATISGTVGHEAIALGKPCVFFGNAFYEGLPNAFRFDEALDLEGISRQEGDAHKLNEAVKTMMTEAADGVIMPFFRGMLDKDVDWSSLMRTTAKSLVRISDAASSSTEDAH